MEAAAAADESASNLTAIELSRGDDDSDTFGRVAQLLDALQQDCDDSRTQIAADAHANSTAPSGPR